MTDCTSKYKTQKHQILIHHSTKTVKKKSNRPNHLGLTSKVMTIATKPTWFTITLKTYQLELRSAMIE